MQLLAFLLCVKSIALEMVMHLVGQLELGDWRSFASILSEAVAIKKKVKESYS